MSEVEFDQIGRLGLIRLNRPQALNALNTDIAGALLEQLTVWEQDDRVAAVAIEGEGPKAFCAGGDIRAIYDASLKGDIATLDAFFRTEYRVNRKIAHYSKPYIALMDGITMGGGVGLSVHGSHRVVTENTVLAMPETAIGLFPDVGGSSFLNHCPGKMGLYLGLTGVRAAAPDLLALGLGTHAVRSANIDRVRDALTEVEGRADVDRILAEVGEELPASPLMAHRPEIDRLFTADSLEQIFANLAASVTQVTEKTAAALAGHCPLSLKVTFEQVRRGQEMSVDEALQMELHVALNMTQQPSFQEGVRALIVDKDKSPKWSPDRIEQVTPEWVAHMFAPSGQPDLTF